MVALRHLEGARADREPEQLMAEADAEERDFCLEQRLDRRHGVFAGRGRVAGPVGQNTPSGLSARMSSALAVAGTTVTAQSQSLSSLRILRLVP